MWFELYRPPSPREVELFEEVLASWFMMGRLGAYNAQNLQVNRVPCLLKNVHKAVDTVLCMNSTARSYTHVILDVCC